MTPWVDGSSRAQLYGVIQIIENIGMLVSEPLLQNVFAASLRLPEAWHSLVFYVAAVSCMAPFQVSFVDHDQAIYAAVGTGTLFIQLRSEGSDEDLE